MFNFNENLESTLRVVFKGVCQLGVVVHSSNPSWGDVRKIKGSKPASSIQEVQSKSELHEKKTTRFKDKKKKRYIILIIGAANPNPTTETPP